MTCSLHKSYFNGCVNCQDSAVAAAQGAGMFYSLRDYLTIEGKIALNGIVCDNCQRGNPERCTCKSPTVYLDYANKTEQTFFVPSFEHVKNNVLVLSEQDQKALYEWMHETLGLRIYK